MPAVAPFINQDNAAILGAKGNAIRWSQFHAERSLAKQLTQPKPIPQPIADDYTQRRITVTRKQIRLLDDQLASCRIPKDLKAIADAIYRLSDLERQLSGRPLPGTLKPERKVRQAVVWSEPEPVQTPQQIDNGVHADPSN